MVELAAQVVQGGHFGHLWGKNAPMWTGMPASAVESITLPMGTSLAQAEGLLMLATLRRCNHHKERTAATLGISLKTRYNRLKHYAAEESSPASASEPAS